MSKGFATAGRIGTIAGLVLFAFGVVGTKLVWLHVVKRDQLLGSVSKARRQLIVETARRGDIVDARGNILATSRSLIVLGVDPQSLRKEDEKKWPQLAELTGVPLGQIQKTFGTKFRPASVATPAPEATSAAQPANLGLTFAITVPPDAPAAADDDEETQLDEADARGNRPIRWAKLTEQLPESVYAQVKKLNVRGVYGARVYRRAYPQEGLAAHVIGYVDRTEHPQAGVEHSTDFYLRGVDGWRESEKDGRREELAQFRTREVPANDGYNVVLSIDANVQHLVEAELAGLAEKYQPAKATIVVSDPRTGFILALGNYPSFSPSEYNKVPREELERLKNVAVGDVYEPGSVFKIVAASGALEENLVTPASTFDCTLRSIEFEGRVRNLPAEDKSDHFDRPLTVAEIIAHSSNKGAAQLAMRLGEQKFYDYARAFGFGQRTGFPGGHEEAGLMASPGSKYWDGLTITRMPMGHSVAVTVLQMHQAMGVIASGGVLLRPQVVRQIRDVSGEAVNRFERVEVRRVISERTAHTMARLLQEVASKNGTAPEAAIKLNGVDFEVAGKTGTTQKLERNAAGKLEYSTKHHVASFVGFFPASNPQVAISVIVDDADAYAPGGVAYGAKTAAPVFKRLGEQLIPYLDIKPAADAAPRPLLALQEGGRR